MGKRREKTTSEALKELAGEYARVAADLKAFMEGSIGPTQQEYIEKINANWPAYNFIVMFGHVYRLTDKVRKKDNGVLRCPCENCELEEYCAKDTDKKLCTLMQANTKEWFEDVGELVIDKKGKMEINQW